MHLLRAKRLRGPWFFHIREGGCGHALTLRRDLRRGLNIALPVALCLTWRLVWRLAGWRLDWPGC